MVKLPRRKALDGLRLVCKRRQSTYTVTRTSTSIGNVGQTVDDSESTHDVSMWVGPTVEERVQAQHGERVDGDLLGYALPSEDLEVADEITYDGDVYELADPPQKLPESGSVKIMSLSFVERE